ncbi:phospholipid hydroperoxide glutathione peroxidase-like [Helicoverpa zea]|uniref:phospholipid hydroperoxide glutathione peroxidase-like n=1 Tax=Helicoverpa zea TaxID=7113 RepID=UPI001F56C6F4|nr:phospholipid hydroperoxide glutathione peroxidase-like [Helicoverpa zea]
MDKIVNNPDHTKAKTIYEFMALDINGEIVRFNKYEGKVCIICNVATKSPFTAQHYKQFNELIDQFGESKGLQILAFPCNQFGKEEPGTSEEIAEHAKRNNVKFDLFAKVDVNGDGACMIWKFLKRCVPGNAKAGDMVKWNYTKFIVNKAGIPVERHGPEVEPYKFADLLNPYW